MMGIWRQSKNLRSKVRLYHNGTHFEPQLASVRAGRLVITYKSGPHASALRLKIYKVRPLGSWQLDPCDEHAGAENASREVARLS